MYRIAALALAPVLVTQGLIVRRRVPVLPEPPGERHGRRGSGPPLRVLIVGDSAAAGVGAPHQEQALTGRLVDRLASTFEVEWKLLARTGATSASTLARLHSLEPSRFDVAVTSLGVNDVTAGVRLATWRRQQTALRALLRERFGVSRLAIAGLPPVEGFPALPQPLRWFLGTRSRVFSRTLQRDVSLEPDCGFVDLRFTMDASLMATDGFHPGPRIYDGWAAQVAAIVDDHL